MTLLALLLACSATPTCDGDGSPLLALGTDQGGFTELGDGDTIDGSGSGLRLALQTSGLDTTQGITTVIRISADGSPTTDSIAALTYGCDAIGGLGLVTATAALPATATDGSVLSVQASATDHRGVNANTELSLTLSM